VLPGLIAAHGHVAGPGSPLLWEISVQSAPQAIEAEGLDYGRVTVLVSTEQEATVAQ